MIKLAFLLMSAAFSATAFGMSPQTVVVDSASSAPLPKASIFDRRGKLVGMTSRDGAFPLLSPADYPVEIRYVGYQPKTLPNAPLGKILMREIASQLPEVVVESGKPRVLHILGFAREYSTLTTYRDTVDMFREKLVDFMIPTRPAAKKFKGWTNPRVLTSRSFYHFRDYNGLDSVDDSFPEHFSWADWVGIIRKIPMPRSLATGQASTDTLMTRYATSRVWRRDLRKIRLDVDAIADTFNLFFIPRLATMISDETDFRRIDIHYDFDNVDGDTVYADNLAAMSFNIESKGRGRNLKRLFRGDSPAFVETYVELYIVDKEFIPVKEARRWEKLSLEGLDLTSLTPADLPPLSVATQTLIARVENVDHDSIRQKIKPDPRIGHMTIGKWDIFSRLANLIKNFIPLDTRLKKTDAGIRHYLKNRHK